MDIIITFMSILYVFCDYNYHNDHLYEHNINEYGLFRHPIRIIIPDPHLVSKHEHWYLIKFARANHWSNVFYLMCLLQILSGFISAVLAASHQAEQAASSY